MKPQFVNKPNLIFNHEVDNIKYYRMDGNLTYWNGKELITIEKVNDKNEIFLTNLASIPKWVTKLTGIKPDRPSMKYPSGLHDGLYGEKTLMKRVYADWCFLRAMKAEGENFFIRWTVFLTVRAFGSEYY